MNKVSQIVSMVSVSIFVVILIGLITTQNKRIEVLTKHVSELLVGSREDIEMRMTMYENLNRDICTVARAVVAENENSRRSLGRLIEDCRK